MPSAASGIHDELPGNERLLFVRQLLFLMILSEACGTMKKSDFEFPRNPGAQTMRSPSFNYAEESSLFPFLVDYGGNMYSFASSARHNLERPARGVSR